MTAPLLDPGAAFLASDPTQLPAGPASLVPPEHDRRRKELELAIAAALVVAVKLVRDRLAARQETVDTARGSALIEWGAIIPHWLQAIVPALLRVYELGHIGAGLTQRELEAVAASYASGLGDYVSESSADALQQGLQAQLSSGWNERVAWQRAAAGYGLDGREMRTYVTRLFLGAENSPELLIPPAARVFADRALLLRADLVGRSEAWTAVETGKALAWMYRQRAGMLPVDAMREWDTAEDESTCATCAPLDGRHAALDEPFQLPSSGRKLWAPQAHPGCRCHVRLVVPLEIAKAWSPQESAKHPTGQGHRFVAKPKARPVMEATRTADPIVSEMMRQAAEMAAGVAEAPPAQLPGVVSLPGTPSLAQARLSAPTLTQPSLKGASLTGTGLRASLLKLPTRKRSRHAAWMEAKAAGNGGEKRIIWIIPPERASKPKAAVEYHLAADEYNMARERVPGYVYHLGQVVDFSVAQKDFEHGTIFANHVDPWFAPDPDVMFAKAAYGDTDWAQQEMVKEQWKKAATKAKPMWQHLMATDPGDVVDELKAFELNEIAERGGLVGPNDEELDSYQIKSAIKNDWSRWQRKDSDGSLAQAFADYVVWQRSDLLGSDGLKFGAFLDTLADQNVYLTNHPVEQVFAFDPRDVRTGDFRDHSVIPTGDYQVVQRTYRSSLEDFGESAMPLHIGVASLHMAPLYVQPGAKWRPNTLMPDVHG